MFLLYVHCIRYNKVADELVKELSLLEKPGTGRKAYDEKNIRRRVYDALNVPPLPPPHPASHPLSVFLSLSRPRSVSVSVCLSLCWSLSPKYAHMLR